jgi:hypothetical protein
MVSRYLSALSALALAVCHGAAGSEDRWPQVIRDAQIANKALLAEGRASMAVEFQPDTSRQELVTVQAQVSWRGEQLLSKVRVRDPSGTLTGTVNAEALENTPWDLRLNDGKALYIFKPITRTLFIYPPAQHVSPMVELHPLHVWLKCCPPGQGRYFMDVIGTFPRIPGQEQPRFEFVQLDARTVRQSRHDPDGGISEIDYDLEQSGNVVRLRYTAPGFGAKPDHGEYHWRMLGSASVLDRLDFRYPVPGKSGAMVEQGISLRVKSVDPRAEPASHFTRSHFTKDLPADTLVDDMILGRRYRMNPNAGLREQDLRDLSDVLRRRGLLKK